MGIEKAKNGVYVTHRVKTRRGDIVDLRIWGKDESNAKQNLDREVDTLDRLDQQTDSGCIAMILHYYGGSGDNDSEIYRLPVHVDRYLRSRFTSFQCWW